MARPYGRYFDLQFNILVDQLEYFIYVNICGSSIFLKYFFAIPSTIYHYPHSLFVVRFLRLYFTYNRFLVFLLLYLMRVKIARRMLSRHS